jgi:hypothetical protein
MSGGTCFEYETDVRLVTELPQTGSIFIITWDKTIVLGTKFAWANFAQIEVIKLA